MHQATESLNLTLNVSLKNFDLFVEKQISLLTQFCITKCGILVVKQNYKKVAWAEIKGHIIIFSMKKTLAWIFQGFIEAKN